MGDSAQRKKEIDDSNKKYNDLMKKYEAVSNEFKEVSKAEADKFENVAKKNTGKAGYMQALGMASKGANAIASGAQQQAQNAYRQAGLNKAQAAQLAGASANQAYLQGIGQQQGVATAQLGANVNAMGQASNQRLQGYGQQASMLGQGIGMNQSNAQYQQGLERDRWQKTKDIMDTSTKAAAAVADGISDKNLKDIKGSLTARDYSQRIDAIMDKRKKEPKNYRQLLIIKKEV